MNKVRENFQAMIRRVLKEELEKRDAVQMRVPEQDGNGLDATGKKNKTFGSDENPKDRKTKDQLLADLMKVVKAISDDYPVVWDDHDDLKIDARDLMSMRITPDWEDHYEIEVFTKNEDRVWVTGLDWEQVKKFVKTNLESADKKPSYVEKAYDKSYRNREDQVPSPDKGMPQDDKPKIKPLTNESPSKTKNKEKTHTEDQNKEEDNPNQPMREVEKYKKTVDHKVEPPVHIRGKRVMGKTPTQAKL
jgi:hypothetical protein